MYAFKHSFSPLVVTIVAKSAMKWLYLSNIKQGLKINDQDMLIIQDDLKSLNLANAINGKLFLTCQGVAFGLNIQQSTTAVQQVTKTQPQNSRPMSKKALSDQILSANTHLSRGEKIKLLMEQLDMSNACASTYIHNFNQAQKAKGL